MISIILPTYNESANLEELLKRIADVMGKRPFEVIIVDDDSPDKTWQKAEQLSAEFPMVRVLRRVGRRGLSSAVVEGFNMAKGDVLLVMDADLQHDPALILQLADAVEHGADIAVASRYIQGGSVGDWVAGRRIGSQVATFLSRKLPRVEVSDPMSGFFAISADEYKKIATKLRPTGFKILLEVLAHLPRGTKTAEVPLHFQMRKHGESKLSAKVTLQLLWQLCRIILQRVQMWLFLIVVIIAAIVLGIRAWNIHLLYTDADVRAQVQTMLWQLQRDQGWIISDISIDSVTHDGFAFTYEQHHRGPDHRMHCAWSFVPSSAVQCVNE
jgi:glycosyltransferase involved in cell wall biosynthesis